MAKKLIVSLSPHVHGRDSVQRNMYGVCIALIPALLTSLYFFGCRYRIGYVRGCLCVLRVGYNEICIETRSSNDNRRFGHPDRTAVGVQSAFQSADMDYPHRSIGSHRYR